MANEAHKEPTMEEILASIRKIISDDEPMTARAAAAPLREVPPEPVNDLTELGEEALDETDQSMFEVEGDEEDTFAPAPVQTTPAPQVTGPEFSFEEMLGTARQAAEEAPPEPAPVTQIPRAVPARPTFHAPETDMTTSARYAQTVLTDDSTADLAAGALGKLISKMEISGDNTIEGLVKEMLKPMIKDWLDANLAKIVEEKVEAEVQRIARMAR
jgi:hypothetical protein